MQRHNKLLDKIIESPLELDAIVARYREEFTGGFFQHLHVLTEACKDDLDKREGSCTHDHVIMLPSSFHYFHLFDSNMALRGLLARLYFRSSFLAGFEQLSWVGLIILSSLF